MTSLAGARAEYVAALRLAGVEVHDAPGGDPPYVFVRGDGIADPGHVVRGTVLATFSGVCVAGAWDDGASAAMLDELKGDVLAVARAMPGWQLGDVSRDSVRRLGASDYLTADVSANRHVDITSQEVEDVALSASVELTPAQILDLFDTPVELVPAPGAGKAILPLGALASYTFGTVAYVDADLFVGWGTVELWYFGNLLEAAASSVQMGEFENPAITAVAAAENLPLTAKTDSPNPTVGDGTVRVTVIYAIVDV